MTTTGGRFDFDDGGTYAGGWEDGKANGHGICTGPKGQGEYAGAWHLGFEISGVYTWSSGNNFRGQWLQGKRHGVGVETKGRWLYEGEWTQGFKGRYGVRQSSSTGAKYEGTWTTGLQDGYGVETYADGGTYQGQWLRGVRNGYGLRQSVPYGLAAHHHEKARRESLTSLRSEHEEDNVVKERDRRLDEQRGGFVLSATRAGDPVSLLPLKKRPGSADAKSTKSVGGLRSRIVEGLKLRKQRSTGDIQDASTRLPMGGGGGGSGGSIRSTISNISHASYASSLRSGTTTTNASVHTDSNVSFFSQEDISDANAVETYTGEWKSDRRSGFGVSERSDGVKYEGEWENNKKHGYGATTFRDGTREEGKYKNNVLITSGKRSKLFVLRANKLRERVQNAVVTANRAQQIAHQKADIAISRMSTARSKAELAVQAADKAQTDADKARIKATQHAPEFFQPGAVVDKLDPNNVRSPLLSFGDHYDTIPRPKQPDKRIPGPTISTKSFLARVTSIAGVGGSGASDKGQDASRKQPPSIASALMSVAMEGSAPLMKTFPGPGPSGRPSFPPVPGVPSIVTAIDPLASSTSAAADAVDHRAVEIHADSALRSTALSPTLIEDHFDQYQTWSQPAASTVFSRHNRPNNSFPGEQSHPAAHNHQSSYWDGRSSRDSGIESNNSRPGSYLSRRTTLSAVGGPVLPLPLPLSSTLLQSNDASRTNAISGGGGGGQFYTQNRSNEKRDLNNPSSLLQPAPSRPLGATIYRPPRSTNLRRTPNIGSMPDVAEASAAAAAVASTTTYQERSAMPREEVHLMSLRRREEIRREREEEERRRRQEVVLSFREFKEWCRERQLIVLVLAVNISLATMFFNLLSY